MSKPTTPPVRMQVRLPADLHLQMQEASVASDRSLNGEIVNRLRSTFKGKRVRQPSGDPLSTDIMASPRERQLAAQQPGK